MEARFLEIELTESCVMSNPEESIAILEELSRMGVLVSVDDFGTGYSSMSYLRRFPIDKLKIEQIWMNVYDGGTTPSPRDQHLYVDNVVVAKKYIGPMK